jgi:hypothetical protein
MIHANIPGKYVKDIREGWNEYYWKKWREYINSHTHYSVVIGSH